MAHAHDLQGQPWPFTDPDNTAVFSCRHVLDGQPILRVTHDEDDGAWQFLCGEWNHVSEDARLVCLGCMAARDKALLSLFDLPLGWCAERDSVDNEWVRAPNPQAPDDEPDVG